MKKKLSFINTIMYGGITKQEFKEIKPLIIKSNLKTWRISSILLCCISLGVFLVSLISKSFMLEANKDQALAFTIIFGALTAIFLALIFLLFFAIDDKHNQKLLFPLMHLSTLVVLASVLVAVMLCSANITIHILFWVYLFALLVFTIDRPIQIVAFTFASIVAYIGFAVFANIHIIDVSQAPIGEIEYVRLIVELVLAISLFLTSTVLLTHVNVRIIHRYLYVYNTEQQRDVDRLTGVRNYYSYQRAIENIDKLITEHDFTSFAVGVFDINDLKLNNDAYGHSVGDELIVKIAGIIRDQFTNSPVYRIGGDEFAVILLDDDYHNRHNIIDEFDTIVHNLNFNCDKKGLVSFAFSIVDYDKDIDHDYLSTFKRADASMYKNKRFIKIKSGIKHSR